MNEDLPAASELPPGDWLPIDQAHRVWWCEGGMAGGLPVLIVHGGPGGASRVEPTRWFSGLPVRWIAIDQRGCGRSTPRGATAHNDLAALLHDMERLRGRLGLARWSLAGGSWGARVALAYAGAFSHAVDGLFLRSPFLGGIDETRRYIAPWQAWLGDAGRQWVGDEAASAVECLYRSATGVLNDGAVATCSVDRVAQAWSAFDDAQSAAGGVAASGARFDAQRLPKAEDAMAAWQVHAHYARHLWGASEACPVGVPALAGSASPGPVSVVWGDADATCDPAAARQLVAASPGAIGQEVPGAGHRMNDPQLGPALRNAAHAWVSVLRASGQ